MGWSYSGDPSSSALDAVRFLLGDTIIDDQLVSDEELNFCLAQFDSETYFAAAAAADALSSRFTREIAVSVDGVNANAEVLQQKFDDLAGNLRNLGRRYRRLGMPYGGGIFKSDITVDDQNQDIVALSIRNSMHDNIRGGASDSGPVYDPETSVIEPQVSP